jgi:hypothetical protein
LFGIIKSEGGVLEPGAVVQDCLQICCNVLSDSETCQRLFYEMGGGWHFKLLDFFSPEVLERAPQSSDSKLGGEEEGESRCPRLWFEHPVRLNCAIFALKALLASLGSSPSKGGVAVIASSADEILRACAHWLIRSGPRELLPHCFSLIVKMIASIDSLAARMFDMQLRYDKTAPGTHTPGSLPPLPHLQFSWPESAAGSHMISLPCLLADRYIYPSASWLADSAADPSACSAQQQQDEHDTALHSVRVLNAMLQRDEVASGMVLQHVLAPPPPPPDDLFSEELGMGSGESSVHVEFGGAVLGALLRSLRLVLEGGSQQSLQVHVGVAVRASNLLALIFVHGGVLASELSTALSTAHIADPDAPPSGGTNHQPILPYLLSMVSRLVRLPGVGYAVASAVLRVLSGAASGCERASRQVTI